MTPSTPDSTPDLVRRVEGVLLAAACGDALGVPYEFETLRLRPGADPAMVGGGLGPYAPGEYSDDTQMAVVIGQVAARRGLLTPGALDAIAEGWIAWMLGGASDIGSQTRQVLARAALRSPGTAAGTATRRAARELHARTLRTGGNGSLMRTGPVALAFLYDASALSEAAREVSGLTHPDEMAGDACVLWCQLVRHAVLTGELLDPRDLLDELPVSRRDEWAALVEHADLAPPAVFNPNGYAPVAWQAAWSAIRHPVSFGAYRDQPLAASLVAAVHAGNDTDTVAAIAGTLLGAVWGVDAIPEAWASAVHGWPGLDGSGLRELARQVAGHG